MPRGQPPSVGNVAKVKALGARSSRALASGDDAGRKAAGDELISRVKASKKEYANSSRGQEIEAKKRHPKPTLMPTKAPMKLNKPRGR